MKLRLNQEQRESIGARLREIRRFNQLEQAQLAERAGVSQAIISQYEKGLTELSLSFIKFLTETFGVSGDWLLFGTGRSPHEKTQGDLQIQIPQSAGGEPSKRKRREGFCQLPIVAPKTAAIPGIVRPDRILGWNIVRADKVGGRENLVVVDIEAGWVENMNAPFRRGSSCVIDRDDKTVHPDAYFALHKPGTGRRTKETAVNAIRRLNLSGQRLWLVEDNPSGQFDYVDLKSDADIDKVVIGRVILVTQRFI